MVDLIHITTSVDGVSFIPSVGAAIWKPEAAEAAEAVPAWPGLPGWWWLAPFAKKEVKGLIMVI